VAAGSLRCARNAGGVDARLGVERLYLFGSTARGEATDESDVDLFFDHEKGKLGLFELMDVKELAAEFSAERPTS
jgi:predicted nucleotidyltransferase